MVTKTKQAPAARTPRITRVAAKEAKNHFGELLDAVQRQPVVITKNGRPVAIMIRYADHSRFNAIAKRIRLALEKKQR